MKEIWKVNEFGGIECECGNDTMGDGFDTCLEDGKIVEPTNESGWKNLYKCISCEKVKVLQF